MREPPPVIVGKPDNPEFTHSMLSACMNLAGRARCIEIAIGILCRQSPADPDTVGSLKSHVHTRANATAIATTAAQRYALAKLDVHVATMVSVH